MSEDNLVQATTETDIPQCDQLSSEWIPIRTMADLPRKPGRETYEQIDCLIWHKGEIKWAVWNCEHLVWDDQWGDDFFCQPLEPSHYMRFPEPPRGEDMKHAEAGV